MTQSSTTQPWTTVLDGQRLLTLRQQRGLSREDLAVRAGISVATVTRLERNARLRRRHRTMARLAAALATAQPRFPGEASTVQTPRALIAAARDLLARTAELPASRRDLHAVMSEYRAVVFAFTTEADRQPHDGTR
jgi:transcriptional regulator with XRE-family HTH domain